MNHGGLSILVKNDIVNGINHMSDLTESSEAIIVKCCKDYFKLVNDLYIINIYISPKSSSWTKRTKHESGYAELDAILLNLAKRGPLISVILNRDLNTRISVANTPPAQNTPNF